jgi:hypothetical protein
MTTTKQTFILPQRPYSVIDAINRYSLATGSIAQAMRTENVDYNGHHVAFVEPNRFKPYWTCYYTWAGIRTIGRGTLAKCLKAARDEYDRGALGAMATVTVENEEDAAACVAAGFVAANDPSLPKFRTDLHDEVPSAFALQRHGICLDAVGYLANSKTLEEYRAKVDADIAAQKAQRTA